MKAVESSLGKKIIAFTLIVFILGLTYQSLTGHKIDVPNYFEELQNPEFEDQNTNVFIIFVVITVVVFFLSTPYGRFLSEMAMYDQC